MSPAEFKRKWSKYSGKETSAYQEHFNDLCALIDHPSPAAADPTGSESFCFQKRVVKDAELFAFEETNRVAEEPEMERGFADVWKRGCFAWEYKGKKKNLDDAYRQLLRYRESLLNPPLLVVCDFERYIVRTNFNGTVQETHEFRNAEIDTPRVLHLLRALFTDPAFLKPQRTTDEVTATLAQQIGEVARSLQERESVELIDAKSRSEHSVAQRKNLRIARFLNRIVFCFFAEDTGLLPKSVVTAIFKAGADDAPHFAEVLEELFVTMAKGGTFGQHKIRHFNGHLFEDATVFELTEDEIGKLAVAGEADWQFIQPSIMGNLFERGLDPDQRAQLGAHYTSEEDIKTLVEPVLMAPLRREWMALKTKILGQDSQDLRNEKTKKINPKNPVHPVRKELAVFHDTLASITVLDPACGSGNFLYVSLQLLLDLEKELITFAAQLGFKFESRVSVQQLKAIELNAYAFELAQVSVQIGYLKWRRDNGFPNDKDPVLQKLEDFQNEDALLVPHFHSKPKSLKAAQAGEHAADDALKFYTERKWPAADVIVGNPPFLGTKKLRSELSDEYVDELFRMYGDRIPNFSDLCCYWFEKAREMIQRQECKRAGLLATQGIRGGLNREVLKRIKRTGDIFFAISDREWILDGANVHVSLIGFDDGTQTKRSLDSCDAVSINSNLTAVADVTAAARLAENRAVGFIADVKAGKFEIPDEHARGMMREPNPHDRPNSDVIVPWVNSLDILRRPRRFWIIDFGDDSSESFAAKYERPFGKVRADVYPLRSKVKRKTYRENWWLHAEPCTEMRRRIAPLPRFLVTTTVSKFRVFAWLESPTLPDHQLVVFARDDDYFFGVLHSRFHEVWALKLGTRLETRPRYTPTTCFETFPFPEPNEQQKHAISTAAKELNKLRENWLNPAEWTTTRVLEFPGSIDGPWSRYVQQDNIPAPSQQTGEEMRRHTLQHGFVLDDSMLDDPLHAPPKIGLVRYPRIEPRDEDGAKKLAKRTLTNLYNERPAWLGHAHTKLDIAVASAYGWSDLMEILEHAGTGEIYDFKTGAYAVVECTPEGLTANLKQLAKEVDEEILKRLLALNLERAANEKSAPKKKARVSRAKTDEELV